MMTVACPLLSHFRHALARHEAASAFPEAVDAYLLPKAGSALSRSIRRLLKV